MGKTLEPKLRQLIKRGGDFDPQSGLDLVAAAAKESGLVWFEADCDKARSRSAVFRAIVKAVDYPQFFGADFDGLYDCLCDTLLDQKEGGFVLVLNNLHSADPAIVTDGEQFLQVLNIGLVCTHQIQLFNQTETWVLVGVLLLDLPQFVVT
jgi:hypothetical protein